MNLWNCPICKQPLQTQERHHQCANRHSFDQAKEGYVNLLLVNKKKSQDPGDSKAMLNSRRLFLQQGFYAPLADALAQSINNHFTHHTDPLRIYDAGCGEGYYLGQLPAQLATDCILQGSDIAKPAMKMAAKRYPDIHFAVASSYDLPLADQSIDVLIRVFSPIDDEEALRVLKPNGLYLWAYPAEYHLFDLRQLVYDDPKPHADIPLPKPLQPLTHETQDIRYPIHLPNPQSIASLLEMTPYYWSASAEKQAYCQQLQTLDLEAHFRLRVMKKAVNVSVE